jgi:hypothetical protein
MKEALSEAKVRHALACSGSGGECVLWSACVICLCADVHSNVVRAHSAPRYPRLSVSRPLRIDSGKYVKQSPQRAQVSAIVPALEGREDHLFLGETHVVCVL